MSRPRHRPPVSPQPDVRATTARCIEQRERRGVGEVIPFQRGVPGSSKKVRATAC
jgi:hypothetical protein